MLLSLLFSYIQHFWNSNFFNGCPYYGSYLDIEDVIACQTAKTVSKYKKCTEVQPKLPVQFIRDKLQ